MLRPEYVLFAGRKNVLHDFRKRLSNIHSFAALLRSCQNEQHTLFRPSGCHFFQVESMGDHLPLTSIADKFGLQRSALTNISEFSLHLPLLQCLLPPNQVGPFLLDSGQLQVSRLPPLQKMKYIQIKWKIHQKRKHYNIHSYGRHFFLTYIWLIACHLVWRTWRAAAVSLLAVGSDALHLSEQYLSLLCRELRDDDCSKYGRPISRCRFRTADMYTLTEAGWSLSTRKAA